MLLASWVATDFRGSADKRSSLAYADLSSIVDRPPDSRLGPLKDTNKTKVSIGSRLGRSKSCDFPAFTTVGPILNQYFLLDYRRSVKNWFGFREDPDGRRHLDRSVQPGVESMPVRGIRTRIVVPSPTLLVASIDPPCASTHCLQIAKPSPEPPTWRDRDGSAR